MATDWSLTPIEYENVTESAALLAAKDAKESWIRVTIRDGDGQLTTIGSDSRRDRYVGVIIIQIFIPQKSPASTSKTGTSAGRILAVAISDIWNGYTGQPCLQIRTPSMNTIGELSGWFQINVNIPFQNDEIS